MAPALLLVLFLGLSLFGCGGPAPTSEVVVVTATFTVPPRVVQVTATFTPSPEAAAPSDTPLPPPTEAPSATNTPAEDTLDQPAQPTQPIEPTATLQPTDTPTTEPTATTPPEPTNTPKPKPTAKPKTSLDAYKVMYSNFDGGDQTDENKYSVWIVRGDGSQAYELLRPAFEPGFSANGNKVAYYRPFNGIWTYNVNTKAAQHIVASDYAEFASFSPDGSRLVFHEWVGNWWGSDVNLYIVNADGSGRTQLPQGIRPAWSPKGGLIAFDSCRGTSCGIFVIQPNGQGFRQVTNDAGGKVAWAPNGKKLTYSAEVGGDPEIWVVNLDGSGRKQLTNNSGNDTMPAFSPDGEYIFFLSDQNGQAWAVRVMKADGSGVKTVRQIGVPPRWQFSRMSVTWWE